MMRSQKPGPAVLTRPPSRKTGFKDYPTCVEGSMKPSSTYQVDLRGVTGEGDFPCPRCGVVISPDDCSERVYTILEPRVRGNSLEELVILCNQCGSEIHLRGFLLLESLAEPF